MAKLTAAAVAFRERINTARQHAGEGAICLFRIGDFYEAFDDDARYCARTLGLTLVSRNPKGQPEWPMIGFPYHQLEAYVAKLVASGRRVAVCEQAFSPVIHMPHSKTLAAKSSEFRQ